MAEQLANILLIGAVIALLAGLQMLQSGGRRRRRPQRPWSNVRPLRAVGTDLLRTVDTADQLRSVSNASFEKKRLLSPSEARFFYAAEKAIADQKLTWRVMAQVCLGEVLASPDPDAFHAINAKRVDLLIVTSSGYPLAAIEYQGEGHYQETAAMRDAVKKEALRRAGVGYIEMTPKHGADDMAREIARLAKTPPRANRAV